MIKGFMYFLYLKIFFIKEINRGRFGFVVGWIGPKNNIRNLRGRAWPDIKNKKLIVITANNE